MLGFISKIHSNGVTVQLEPILPGTVRDGNLIGIDLAFQTDTTSISANWDGFGYNDIKQSSQIIMFYEVAVGTDRRKPETRDNIHSFINVGLNNTWTFSNLKLSSDNAYYYVTVRAHGLSSALTEVTSNGIQLIKESGLVAPGELNVQRYE
jgi:hypothetical protein